jgi:hypothetical protein
VARLDDTPSETNSSPPISAMPSACASTMQNEPASPIAGWIVRLTSV